MMCDQRVYVIAGDLELARALLNCKCSQRHYSDSTQICIASKDMYTLTLEYLQSTLNLTIFNVL